MAMQRVGTNLQNPYLTTFSQKGSEHMEWPDVFTVSTVRAFKNNLDAHLNNLPRRLPEKTQQNAPSTRIYLRFSWFFYILL